jgi:hypothetical protein
MNSTRSARFIFLPVIFALAFCLLTFAPSPALSGPTSTSPEPSGIAREQVSDPIRHDIGFSSRQKLVEHYRKHGSEFGSVTMDEYVRQAQELRDRRAGGNVLELTRSDGVICRFDRATGSFLAFNPDGVIRTYFRPNDGEAYFRRQSKRQN